MSDNDKKLKPMSEAMALVAVLAMELRGDPASESAKATLTEAIYQATPELVAAGLNIFNTGPALLAIENCKTYAGSLVVHYELDKLRRMLGLEKPAQITRGPGGGR
jgi:hypothetical protein